jgi:hypothetical protein
MKLKMKSPTPLPVSSGSAIKPKRVLKYAKKQARPSAVVQLRYWKPGNKLPPL